jgi:hypothetical protein
MRTFVVAAAAAMSLGIKSVADAAHPIIHQTISTQQARNGVVLRSQRPVYVAGNSSVLPSQRPA